MNKEGYIMKILSIDEAKKYVGGKQIVIITGVTGQDGSFMVDYLLKHTNYEIFGGARRLSVANHANLDHLVNEPRFHLINFDLTDAHSITQVISQLNPSYFINFAAQSFVKSSWDFPTQTWETNTTAVIHILEAIRLHCPLCRFYNAGSSEEFGNVDYSPQDEKHPLKPRSPYGASKAAVRQIVKVYRESYGLYAIQGWLFNHEGTRRGEEFVTRKITKGVARIHAALENGEKFEPLELGNVDAERDWSDAEDMVDAVWRMLNQEVSWAVNQPIESWQHSVWHKFVVNNIKEYVVSSGETHSIREFVEKAFKAADIHGEWLGDGLGERFVYLDRKLTTTFPFISDTLRCLVKINPNNYRPAEVDCLKGNPTQIKSELKWIPVTTFDALVEKMVLNDLNKEPRRSGV